MEILQMSFAVTGKELPLSQMKQGKHSIDSSVRMSPLTMHKHSIDTSVRKSPLTMHSINSNSVSKSPLTKEKILEVYADVFKDLGTFPGEPYRFRLKENYMSARHALRKVPIHVQEDFYAEIHNLVKQGILEKVEHPTEWVNSFIIVKKDVSMDSGNSHAPHHKVQKKLQICLDPRDLNETLKCEPYYS